MSKKTPPLTKPTAAGSKASLAASGFDSVSLMSNYEPLRQPTGKVVGVWGDALIRRASGKIEAVQVGDEVRKGDVILTTQHGIVQLEGASTRMARLPGLFETDRALAGNEEEFEAPGAGLTGGDGGGLLEALRVDRINEVVTPNSYNYDSSAQSAAAAARDTVTTAALPTLSVSSITVPEGSAFAVFSVQLSAVTATAATVGLALTNGSAAGAATDYGRASNPLEVSLDGGATWATANSVSLSAGQTQFLVRTPIVDDALDEAPETFTLTATPLTANLTAGGVTGTATITDNDPQPGLSVADGGDFNEGAPFATFVVTLNQASGQVVTVNWTTIDGVAAGGTDFATSSGTLTFQPGETSKTIQVPILNDSPYEGPETFSVQLGNAVNADITDGTGIATIRDDGQGQGGTDNDIPALSIADAGDFNEAAGFAVFTVTLSQAAARAVTVDWSTASGSALAGSDFTAQTGTLTFAPGQTTQTLRVAITNDSPFEGPESFFVNLANPTNATITDGSATATIRDDGLGAGGTDNDTPVVSIADAGEYNEGAAFATFTVTLSAAAARTVTVAWSTADGTAQAGSDYTPRSGVVTFEPGATTATLQVPILNDAPFEGSEAFVVNLSNPVNATLGDSSAVATIRDDGQGSGGTDNDTPTLAIADAGDFNEGAGAVAFTVTLSAAAARAVTVDWSTLSGSAIAGSDFQALTGTLTFAAGETTKTILVPIVNDALYEGIETFSVQLSNPVNATLADASGNASIRDDGLGQGGSNDDRPTLSVGAPSASEGDPLDFVVSLSNPSTTALPYTLSLDSGTGTAGTDTRTPLQVSFDGGAHWTDISGGSVTVPAGTTSFLVRVPTTEDSFIEGNETVRLTVGGSTGVGTIVNDDVLATLSESALPDGNLEAGNGQAAATDTDLGSGTASGPYSFSASSVSALNAAGYTSDGQVISWAVVAGTTLVATAGNGDGSSVVLTVALDTASGATHAQLVGPFDHTPGNGQNTLSLAPIEVVDASGDSRSLTLDVVDDTPNVGSQERTVVSQDTNLLIVLDLSGSMNFTDGRPADQSRLAIALGSIKELIKQYADVGEITVTLTTFNTTSSGAVLSGATAEEALARLNDSAYFTSRAAGFTNYAEALANAQTQFGAVLASSGIDGASNVSYFVSDGKPEGATADMTEAFKPQGTVLTNWTQFLQSQAIQSIAVGTGSQVTAPSTAEDFRTALNQVAYDGRNAVDTDIDTQGVYVVANAADLSSVLSSTVPEPLSGSLLTGTFGTETGAGADGGSHVASLVVDGVTYTFDGTHPPVASNGSSVTYDASAHTLVISLGSQLTLAVDMVDGSYALHGHTTAPVTVRYSIMDNDGDSSGATLGTLTLTAERAALTSGGTLGADALNGGNTADLIDGRAGNDTISAGAGDDVIYGGRGDDLLTGGTGSDVFAWRLTDRGTTTTPAVDTVTDFNKAPPAAGGDVLDLRDLLQGEAGKALTNYLQFETQGDRTLLHISSSGQVASGHDQTIVFQGANYFGTDATATIIQNLIDQGKLLVDS